MVVKPGGWEHFLTEHCMKLDEQIHVKSYSRLIWLTRWNITNELILHCQKAVKKIREDKQNKNFIRIPGLAGYQGHEKADAQAKEETVKKIGDYQSTALLWVQSL